MSEGGCTRFPHEFTSGIGVRDAGRLALVGRSPIACGRSPKPTWAFIQQAGPHMHEGPRHAKGHANG